jgi:hypothetical protein
VNEDDDNKEKRTDDIGSWDAEFLKVDQGTLFELILVCCYKLFVFIKFTNLYRRPTIWILKDCWM